jgi:hypothetical protein
MCIVKTPKIDPVTQKPKEPTVIRNAYLDAVDPRTKAARAGRSSLRIDRGMARPAAPNPTAPRPAPSVPFGGLAGQSTVPVGSGGGGRIDRATNIRAL